VLVCGLDVSASVTGVCIYESLTKSIIKLDHIDFKNCKDVWQKADHAANYINNLNYDVQVLAIEEIAKMFSPGASSAGTIVTLARFNGLVSYIARNHFKKDPVHITPALARRTCGLKMLQKNKDPQKRSHKEQTFDLMMASDLKHIQWPLKKRSTKLVDWSRDCVDAYVIAKAGSILKP